MDAASPSWTTALSGLHFVTALSHAYVVKQRMRALPWRVGASPTLQAVRATKHITMSVSACVLQSESRFVCEYPLNSGALLVMNKKQGLWCGRDANKHDIMYTRRTCPTYPLNRAWGYHRNKVCSYWAVCQYNSRSTGNIFGNNKENNKLNNKFWEEASTPWTTLGFIPGEGGD